MFSPKLLDCFKQLGALRKEHPALRKGDIRYLTGVDALLAFTRTWGEETLLCTINAEDDGLQASQLIDVTGGTITVTALGKAVNCDGEVNISEHCLTEK